MATQTLPPTRWRNPVAQRKSAAFVDVGTGSGVTHDGSPIRFSPTASLRELVDSLPAASELLYLCGPLPGSDQPPDERYSPFSAWILESCQPQELGHGADRADFLAKVPRSDGRSLVAVRTVACWFGTNTCTPTEAALALGLVEGMIKRQHGWELATLTATPAGTGLDLWRRSIPFARATGHSHEYAPLPKELRDLIHRTSGQGNFTYLPARSMTLPALVDLDMRLAYAAAAMEEIGSAPATHDHVPTYLGFQPARYRIRYQVPVDWRHVGLFMTPDPHSRPGQRSWCFPNAPGYVGECWADASELRVASGPFPRACEHCRDAYRHNAGQCCPLHGWLVTIFERVVFTKDRPLRTWAEKLVQLREDVTAPPAPPHVIELARAAVRNILVHTIGAFHHRPRQYVTQSSADPADVPDHTPFAVVPTEYGELLEWRAERQGWTDFDYQRPEWSAQIWGHTRAALLLHREVHNGCEPIYTGALTLPYEQIVALRLDSLLVTDNPHWPDDGKVGRFRVKGQYPGPIPWPHSEDDLSLLEEVPHAQ